MLSSTCCAVINSRPRLFQIFYPETTDIYDRKNMPRCIYCIHALRYPRSLCLPLAFPVCLYLIISSDLRCCSPAHHFLIMWLHIGAQRCVWKCCTPSVDLHTSVTFLWSETVFFLAERNSVAHGAFIEAAHFCYKQQTHYCSVLWLEKRSSNVGEGLCQP